MGYGLSLQEQQINKLKTLFANAGANNIDSKRFKEITDFIQSKLDNMGQSQTNTQLNQLEEDIEKKEREIKENDRNLDTIEKELEKYNKPNLSSQEKEDKTKLDYQIADLQSKKEKLNKEK